MLVARTFYLVQTPHYYLINCKRPGDRGPAIIMMLATFASAPVLGSKKVVSGFVAKTHDDALLPIGR